MDSSQQEFFRSELLRLQKELMGESQMTLHDMQVESTLYPDPNDRASLESEHLNVLRIRDRERRLLGKVYEALKRIEDGEFGYCEECGGPISVERLKIRPVTTYCIQCKQEQESKEFK